MLEIGEYARTKDGIIDKIKTINKYGTVTKYDDKEDKISVATNCYINSGLEVNEDDIVKHSKNIIDLIEEGDYINGYPVRRILNFNNELCNFDLNTMEWTPLKDIDVYYNILTKELYQANCYTIKRKE